MMHYDEQGACLYCDTIKAEKEAGVRVVLETGRFIVIEPFAARSPFETWILPKEHDSNFEETSVDGCKELAAVVQQILGKISKILNNPDYNYVILSAPAHERGLEYYHWHLKIIPRVSATAGFEIGSGMFINPVIPEEAARYLREA
jgi:UDPglucose--hexose-1-phosphate uridylyltransferase